MWFEYVPDAFDHGYAEDEILWVMTHPRGMVEVRGHPGERTFLVVGPRNEWN